ncbi:MAG TPA: hypothetical protein VJB57_08255 [Dehalococcoidia bacterium]|nr:hypothetical protein [Dehalococcoidia bacterium]
MLVTRRALIIGLMGPAIQAVGFLWQVAHFYIAHHHDSFSVRHLVFEPGLLMVIVGFLVSVVCVPLALEVTKASEAELEIPAFGTGEDSLSGGLKLPETGGASTRGH